MRASNMLESLDLPKRAEQARVATVWTAEQVGQGAGLVQQGANLLANRVRPAAPGIVSRTVSHLGRNRGKYSLGAALAVIFFALGYIFVLPHLREMSPEGARHQADTDTESRNGQVPDTLKASTTDRV